MFFISLKGNIIQPIASDDIAWSEENSQDRLHPVGGKKPNELVLYDMNGNVWELCENIYTPVNDNTSVKSDYSDKRIVRGGDCFDDINYYKLFHREHTSPDNRYYNLGFRIAFDAN